MATTGSGVYGTGVRHLKPTPVTPSQAQLCLRAVEDEDLFGYTFEVETISFSSLDSSEASEVWREYDVLSRLHSTRFHPEDKDPTLMVWPWKGVPSMKGEEDRVFSGEDRAVLRNGSVFVVTLEFVWGGIGFDVLIKDGKVESVIFENIGLCREGADEGGFKRRCDMTVCDCGCGVEGFEGVCKWWNRSLLDNPTLLLAKRA